MKINNYIRKSLSRQVVYLMWGFLVSILIGTSFLFYFQQNLGKQYIDDRERMVKKRQLTQEISGHINSALFDIRGYLALDNVQLKDNALAQENHIRILSSRFSGEIKDKKDQEFYSELLTFTEYYFDETLPVVIKAFEEGDRDKVKSIASASATKRVTEFQNYLSDFSLSLDRQLNQNAENLRNDLTILQIALVSFIILLLLIMQIFVRIIVKNIGKPLSDFAYAANEIAAGRDAAINVQHSRTDELGALSVAFNKMIVSLQDKEQNLLAQNEELMAQQDQLHAQQIELEEALVILKENEKSLSRRNELINGISNTLDKNELLSTIVESMGRIISADKGMIALLSDDSYASFGISDRGVRQFMENMRNGMHERLFSTKRAFCIKREQEAVEKGYHENINFCYDLYIPVQSVSTESEAILVFSRFSHDYSEKELHEYETLAKQIAISLEKIKLFEQTEHNRRLNQDILNTVQEGIQLINNEGTIVQVNQKLCELFGCSFTVDNMSGLTWDRWTKVMSEQVQEENFESMLKETVENAAAGKAKDYSFQYSKKDSKKVYTVYCETLTTGNGGAGSILVHRDITKEYEVDQMKSEFVSTVSHELRTPLASVLGFTELILNKELKPERQKKYLQTIYNEAKRLTSLINDFLDVQRMESGKQMYEKKYLDLLPIIDKVVESQEVNTSKHMLQVQSLSKENIILGDKSKIQQVFTNLINNAVKYSPSGGDIAIKIYQTEHEIKVDVTDQGLGIPNDSIEKLFQKFYRIDNSDRKRIGGTGLGLSIVDEIMKGHHGQVTVESEYGRGSTFTLSFPKVQMKNGDKEQDLPEAGLFYNIMVIEDDINLADLIRQELVETGFNVGHFKNGREAIEAMKMEPPDAIVLDIMLEDGDVDGWFIMKHMKQSKELRNVPIFVSTAIDDRERGLSLGASDYLVKPYQPSQLSKIIMQTLLSNGKHGQIMVPE
ncbi:ATP-binding protein [Peribacillus glennii]|uniref:histidine kinase n=1 Tax=Peribacillus glennii TaxID=2303991 RepID=A0A372LHU7_9BACI|nr:ATP-binding protein [Peribacillus glennii]RFU65863.1 response regulator [Peribacillus glennii]